MPAPPRIMGILNVTPDSFSDGGRYLAAEAAVGPRPRARRPGRRDHRRRRRVDPAGRRAGRAAEELPARRAGDRGARRRRGRRARSRSTPRSSRSRAPRWTPARRFVNDVTALPRRAGARGARRRARRRTAASCTCRGSPRTMQRDPRYRDVVGEVDGVPGRARARPRSAAGVARERILIDPGIGFGKTVEHNLELLARLQRARARSACRSWSGPRASRSSGTSRGAESRSAWRRRSPPT